MVTSQFRYADGTQMKVGDKVTTPQGPGVIIGYGWYGDKHVYVHLDYNATGARLFPKDVTKLWHTIATGATLRSGTSGVGGGCSIPNKASLLIPKQIKVRFAHIY